MAEQIVIAELQINTKALQDSNAKMIVDIARLKQEQKDLQKETNNLQNATESQSLAFVENDAKLKQLNSEYANNKKVLAESSTGIAGLNDALKAEISTVGEAEKSNKKLSIIRSQITTDTQAGRDAIDEINKKLDKNNEYIGENSDKLKQQKQNIGNYQSALEGADSILAKFGVNGQQARNTIEGFRSVISTGAQAVNDVTDKIGDATKNVLGFKNATTLAKEAQIAQTVTTGSQAASTKALAGSQLASAAATNVSTLSLRGFAVALAATGIGLIVLAVVALTSYLSKLDPVMDKIEQITSGVGAAFSALGKAIANLSFSNLINGMGEAYDAAVKLKQAQQDLADQQAIQEVANARAGQQYDELILKSKNRTLTETQRIDFLKQAEKIENENFKERSIKADAELKNAQEASRIKGELTANEIKYLQEGGTAYAIKLMNAKKINQEEVDLITKAEMNKISIQAESTKRLEKNQNAQDKLDDDRIVKREKANEKAKADNEKAIQKRKERQDQEIQIMNDELSLYIANENLKNKSTIDQIDFIFQVSRKRLAILQKEYEQGKVSKAKYEEEILKINDDSAKAQSDRFIAKAKSELDLFIAQNVTKLDNTKLLNQDLINEENLRLEAIKAQKLVLLEEDKKTNQELIDAKIANGVELSNSDREYLTEKLNLENDFRITSKANQDAFNEQVKQQRAEQLIADREIALADSQTQLEFDNLNIQNQYADELLQFKEQLDKKALTQEQYDAKVIQADKKKKDMLRAADLTDTKNKLLEFQKLGSGLEGLFGKNKAVSSALAVVNTGLAVTEILSTKSVLPEPIASISRVAQIGIAVATGAKAIGDINGAKFEKGGLQEIGGNRHSAGGTKFVGEDGTRFEAEQGELIGVINRNAARAFMDFNNSYPSGARVSSSNVFASGGFVNQQNFANPTLSLDIDYDLLANKIGQANMKLPNPVVDVKNILGETQNYVDVVAGANH